MSKLKVGQFEKLNKIEQKLKLDKIENWTKFKIGQYWKLDKLKKLDKIENWTKLKIGQNWKLDKIENWTKLKKLTNGEGRKIISVEARSMMLALKNCKYENPESVIVEE